MIVTTNRFPSINKQKIPAPKVAVHCTRMTDPNLHSICVAVATTLTEPSQAARSDSEQLGSRRPVAEVTSTLCIHFDRASELAPASFDSWPQFIRDQVHPSF